MEEACVQAAFIGQLVIKSDQVCSSYLKLGFLNCRSALRHHHLHHAVVWGNYAPFLSWLDKLIGTEILLEDEAMEKPQARDFTASACTALVLLKVGAALNLSPKVVKTRSKRCQNYQIAKSTQRASEYSVSLKSDKCWMEVQCVSRCKMRHFMSDHRSLCGELHEQQANIL